MRQRRNRKGQFLHSDHERKQRQPKRTLEQEVEYVGLLTVAAMREGRIFSAKLFAREAASLAYKIIGRGEL